MGPAFCLSEVKPPFGEEAAFCGPRAQPGTPSALSGEPWSLATAGDPDPPGLWKPRSHPGKTHEEHCSLVMFFITSYKKVLN